MAWDPGVYLRFDSERTRAALDLLARIAHTQPSQVVDLGCGPGNSTAILAARWPDATIHGVDSDEAMILKARTAGVAATFAVADFGTWAPQTPPDVIFSNAALHWSADPVALSRRLFSLLADNGVLAFQIPQNFDQPTHVIPHALAADYAIADSRWYDPDRFPKAADFARAFPDADIWTTEYVHHLKGEDPVFDWVSGSALRPFLAALGPAPREGFVAEVKARYREAYPADGRGVVHFPFRRLFVVARRNTAQP